MNRYGRTSVGSLVVQGLIALIVIVVLVWLFKIIFSVVAALLTFAIIALGIYFVLKLLNGSRRRY